jgi:hypothetical protein
MNAAANKAQALITHAGKSPDRIEILKQKINNSQYLDDAIWQMANELSNELMGEHTAWMIDAKRRSR